MKIIWRLLIIGIILVAGVLVAGFYFYNFHVFKTLRLCVGEAEDTKILCGATPDCMNLLGADIEKEFENTPNFIQKNFKRVVEEVVYCEGTCFVKKIRGINLRTRKLEFLDSCNPEEKEIVIEIRGKDGLEIWNYLKSLNDSEK